MLPDRRILAVLLGALVVGGPAAMLAGLCVGKACPEPAPPAEPIPFCSLPPDARSLLAAGFRDGRSPHIMAVTAETPVVGSSAVPETSWPSAHPGHEGLVPMVFAGTGVAPGAEVPAGTRLDAIAPTLEEIIGLRRPHPGVRSGTSVEGLASGERPRLVLVVAWKGVGGAAPRSTPHLDLLFEDGAGTRSAEVGSLPLDPAAALATIGTGALPKDHGMTGTLLRNDEGEVVHAFGAAAPFSVVAALGDDLDELRGQEPEIGVVGTDPSDRGLIGGTWYVEHDEDDVLVERDGASVADAVEQLLASGRFGSDETTDLLAVAMEGSPARLDGSLARVIDAAEEAAGTSVLVVVTGTGSNGSQRAGAVSVSEVEAAGEGLIAATAVGGVFVDQEALREAGVTDDRVLTALRDLRDSEGGSLFRDVFPAVAVTFARYC